MIIGFLQFELINEVLEKEMFKFVQIYPFIRYAVWPEQFRD